MRFAFRDELGKITPRIAKGAKVYIFGAGASWENICKQYKYLVGTNLNCCIDGFIDNNTTKQGTQFCGKPVYALHEIDPKNDVVLVSVTGGAAVTEIIAQLTNAGMVWRHSFFDASCFMAMIMRWEYLRLMQFKDIHKGKRCFIIGNGPSLSVRDLEKLKKEITFATNRIYLLFDQTEWRPSYYMIHDSAVLKERHKEIKNAIECPLFYAYGSIFELEDFSLTGSYFYYLDNRVDWRPVTHKKPKFSEEPFVMQWGATVTYDCIQLAAYMGFSEIYLIGVDNEHSLMVKNDGTLVKSQMNSHFSKEYGIVFFNPLCDIVDAAYQTAQEYSESHGIGIFNATRGGNLEVFKRVDFDSLFKQK